jgi:hypothetical protein
MFMEFGTDKPETFTLYRCAARFCGCGTIV